MSIPLVVNNVTYNFPSPGEDPGWGEENSAWAEAITDLLNTVAASTGVGLLSTQIIVGNSFNEASSVYMTGDVIIDNTGVTSYNGVLPVTLGGSGSSVAPTSGQLLIGNAGGTAYAPLSLSGAITVNNSGVTVFAGTVPVNKGGTGLTSGTSGGILGFTASGTIASSVALTTGQLIVGGGAGATPVPLSAGSQYQVVTMGASNPAYGAVNLAQSAAVTGSLPIANGGTGVAAIADLISLIIPSGIVTTFGGSSAPTGWSLCNGSAINRTTFASLFSAIGTTYGVGDGSTTFNLPDLRGIFIRGVGTNGTLTARTHAGVLGTYTEDSFLSHTHTATDAGHTHSDGGAFSGRATTGGLITATSAVAGTVDNTTSTTGVGAAAITNANTGGSETAPANLAMNYIIKN